MQVDHLFRDAKTPVFSPFVNEIPKLPFEYEYLFTEHKYDYEYEKNQWGELLATRMPQGVERSSTRRTFISLASSCKKH